MGYTIKQKIDICLKAESNPEMTQSDLADWAHQTFKGNKKPSQTTISRILSSKNDLIASKQADFQLVRRRKRLNPILRQILTEWVTQSIWENIPITTPIIQSTANSIWTRLPIEVKDGNGVFNHKWCTQFIKDLHINLTGNDRDKGINCGYKLNKIWGLDEKLDLKNYLKDLICRELYKPEDIFAIEEFQLFYSLPLDQIFDINSIDKGLKQSSSSTENSLTIMLGTNLDGSEKLTPVIVGKHDKFDVSKSSHNVLKNFHNHYNSLDNSLHAHLNLMNKLTETYNVFYKNNINKWITSTMFQNYLITLDHKLANNTPDRQILIILDDSSTHRILNLKFNNIKLIYLKNNTSHKSPFNSLFNGVNFDFCPMNFGIVHEFKTLYRLQQYLEMISLQNKSHASNNQAQATYMDYKIDNNSLTTDVLSETDYVVPLIKAIEWIKRAWDTISPEKILLSWHRTHLVNFKESWPENAMLLRKIEQLPNLTFDRNYKRLITVMQQLNVVLPWKTDELLGLVNERSKATLNYISIEEIITSCLSESNFIHETEADTKTQRSNNENWVISQMLNPSMDGFNDIDLESGFNLGDSVFDQVPPQEPPIQVQIGRQLQHQLLRHVEQQPREPMPPGQPAHSGQSIQPVPSIQPTQQPVDSVPGSIPQQFTKSIKDPNLQYDPLPTSHPAVPDATSQLTSQTEDLARESFPTLSSGDSPAFKDMTLDNNSLSISALLAAADEMKQNDITESDDLRHLSSVPNVSQTQLLKHKLLTEDTRETKKRQFFIPSTSPTVHLNDSLPSSTTSSPYLQPHSYPKVYSGITFKSPSVGNLQSYSKNFSDRELMKSMIRLMEASKVGALPITKETYRDLKASYRILQNRAERDSKNHTAQMSPDGSGSESLSQNGFPDQ